MRVSSPAVRRRFWLACRSGAGRLCVPSTIDEAERKGDVAWLDQNGTPDAVAALGRLADTQAEGAGGAREPLVVRRRRRSAPRGRGVVRGAPWGTTMLRDGAGRPEARGPARRARWTSTTPRLVASSRPTSSSALHAPVGDACRTSTSRAPSPSVGPPAHDAITRRLADASTRGAMCRGIASKDADADARKALLDAPVGVARRERAAWTRVVHIAAERRRRRSPGSAETGRAGAARAPRARTRRSRARSLHVAWAKALAARAPEGYSALTVPLGYAVKRCTAEMDGVARRRHRAPAGDARVRRRGDRPLRRATAAPCARRARRCPRSPRRQGHGGRARARDRRAQPRLQGAGIAEGETARTRGSREDARTRGVLQQVPRALRTGVASLRFLGPVSGVPQRLSTGTRIGQPWRPVRSLYCWW